MTESEPTWRGLSDAPIMTDVEDTLNMKAYAEALAEFARTCKTPMTMSIQGDWGSGKSSIMHMIQSGFKNGPTKTIWFDTWQFAQFGSGDTLPITLLDTFIRQLEDGTKTKNNLGRDALSLVTKLFHSPLGKTFVRAGTAGAVNIEDWSKLEGQVPMPGELLTDLRKKLEELLKEKGRVVFFVDDLDRIPPVQAVTLLETIKIFLNVPNVVFILALDYEVVERGLKDKFKLTRADLGGRSFFDKLIQLPFSIPVGSYKVKEYLGSALYDLGYLEKSDLNNLDPIVSLVEQSVGRNPRAIKRVLNSLHLLRLIKEKVGEAEKGKNTLETALDALELDLAVLCLQSQFEPVYNWLSRGGALRQRLDGMMDRVSRDEAVQDGAVALDSYQATLKQMFEKAKEISVVRMAQEQSRYETFKDTFLRISGIGEDAEEEDAKTIEPRIDYLARTLNLTRVTSSNAETVIESEMRSRPVDADVRRALRELTRSGKPEGFWARMTSLHKEISAEPHKTIQVRQKDTENAVWFSFNLRRLPAYVKIRIADDRADISLRFDGRTLRNTANRAAYLERLRQLPCLHDCKIMELPRGEIRIASVEFTDSSIASVRGREPALISEVVEFLFKLHLQLPADQL